MPQLNPKDIREELKIGQLLNRILEYKKHVGRLQTDGFPELTAKFKTSARNPTASKGPLRHNVTN
jgi:hypothetical protein